MYDSQIKLIQKSLVVANNALMGKPEALYEQLGDNRDIILERIAARAERYERMITECGGK